MPGSGKSTAAQIFAKLGFEVVEGSSVIKEEMRKRGMKVTPETVEAFANRMKSEKGKAVFAVMTGKRIRVNLDGNDILLVGFRSIAEFETVEREIGYKVPLIVVMTPLKLRFKRLSQRKVFAIKSPELFTMRDRSSLGQGIGKLMGKADYVISNTGSKKELAESIHELLEGMKEGE